jgi:transcriptional regulator with XRE-family HTH domain
MSADAKGTANRLQMARKLAGLSQGQVAKLLGVQRPTVSEMEAGRRRITVDELVSLSKVYSVSLEWLAKGATGHPSNTEIMSLAARKLEKMRPDDLKKVIEILSLIEEQRREQGNKG